MADIERAREIVELIDRLEHLKRMSASIYGPLLNETITAISTQAGRVAKLEGALEGLLDYTEDLLRQYNCVWADCGDGGIKPEEEEDIVEARKALGRDGEG